MIDEKIKQFIRNKLNYEKNRWASLTAEVLPATPKVKTHADLTIGMATYDDFDGVYFTILSILIYHPEVVNRLHFLVIDNNPTGQQASALKELENFFPNYRYVPFRSFTGPFAKDILFRESTTEFVCCVDSHVLFAPGSIKELLDYFEKEKEDTPSLVSGPLLSRDGLTVQATHEEPIWDGGLFGRLALEKRWLDSDKPYDLDMHIMALFACRKSAWPGYNPLMRGFGGEEGYVHERFRRAGGRTIGLPKLKWSHRFIRPSVAPYPLEPFDRVRNFEVAWDELGYDPAPMRAYFKHHGASSEDMQRAERAPKHPLSKIDALFVISEGDEKKWIDFKNQCNAHEFDWRIELLSASLYGSPHSIVQLQNIVRYAKYRNLNSFAIFCDDARVASSVAKNFQTIQKILNKRWEVITSVDENKEPSPCFIAVNSTCYDRILSYPVPQGGQLNQMAFKSGASIVID